MTNISHSIIVSIVFMPLLSISQEWGGEKPQGFWDHWSINANAGLTSYFGDLSYYDADLTGKLSFESGLAGGFLLTKHVSKLFGVSGQLLYGNLKGGNNQNISFQTQIIEYNMHFRFDFVRLFIPQRNPKFGLEGFAGIGQMWFSAEQFKFNEGAPSSLKTKTDVPEFVYFAGAGMHYHLNENFAITASGSLRQLQNDKLDLLVKNDDSDYYSYVSMGITFYIESKHVRPLKNKSQLAHTSKRLR